MGALFAIGITIELILIILVVSMAMSAINLIIRCCFWMVTKKKEKKQ